MAKRPAPPFRQTIQKLELETSLLATPLQERLARAMQELIRIARQLFGLRPAPRRRRRASRTRPDARARRRTPRQR